MNSQTRVHILLRIGLAAALLFPIAASAATYKLLDHPHGMLVSAQGPYGLRMDVLDPPAGPGPVFSVEQGGASVFLTWDGGSIATISGTLRNNHDNTIWDVSYSIPVTDPKPKGFVSKATGVMTLTDPSNVDHIFDSKGNNKDKHFLFLADGHRIPGDKTTPVGRGWLDANGVNDWLVRAVVVPLPPAAWLLAAGFLALVCVARRRGAQS